MKTQKGFTLIELLVVISIIGMLSSIVLAALNSARNSATIAAGIRYETHVIRSQGDRAALWFNFDEAVGATTAVDRSGNGLNGTFTNSPITVTPGTTGPHSSRNTAYGFGGSGAVSIPYNTKLIPSTTGYTMMAWVNPASHSTPRTVMSAYLPFFRISATAGIVGQVHFRTGCASGCNAAGFIDVYSGTPVPIGQWTHVAVVYESAGYSKIYINGKLSGTYGPALTNNNYYGTGNTHNFTIGALSGPTISEFFLGKIDEPVFINESLTIGQIQEYYAQSKKELPLN